MSPASIPCHTNIKAVKMSKRIFVHFFSDQSPWQVPLHPAPLIALVCCGPPFLPLHTQGLNLWWHLGFSERHQFVNSHICNIFPEVLSTAEQCACSATVVQKFSLFCKANCSRFCSEKQPSLKSVLGGNQASCGYLSRLSAGRRRELKNASQSDVSWGIRWAGLSSSCSRTADKKNKQRKNKQCEQVRNAIRQKEEPAVEQ